MKKAWSISTTLRNPERLISFLKVLKQIEGEVWNFELQKKYQILLIQNRLYGYGVKQFLYGLEKKDVELISDVTQPIAYEKAERIFNSKNYEDPAMRGRQSINPLKKLGFVSIVESKIVINEIGNKLISDDYDLGDVFFNCFLKWQIPNPQSKDYKVSDGYDIIPFVGILKLYVTLKTLYANQGLEFKGLSKEEFNYFVPTLIHYSLIEDTAKKIFDIRSQAKDYDFNEKKQFLNNCYFEHVKHFLETERITEINKVMQNLRDYGDNIFRYFRLTRYFYLRGNGFYIDIEPRRTIEISELLNIYTGKSRVFENKENYNRFLQDYNQPELPWQKNYQQKEIISQIVREIDLLKSLHGIDNVEILPLLNESNNELNKYIDYLRLVRKDVQNKVLYKESQTAEQLMYYIKSLQNINKHPNKALELEKLISYCMYALNDALKISPNHPVGDDNEPIFFAPANKPDIECFYDSFNAICEVTMLKSRDQWFNEGQPVMRHLREFENNSDKETFCIFIAPSLHRDTLNTFWFAVKYEYEGTPQKIIPFTINDFISLLEIVVGLKNKSVKLTHNQIQRLLIEIIAAAKNENKVADWLENIPIIISNWGANLLRNNNAN